MNDDRTNSNNQANIYAAVSGAFDISASSIPKLTESQQAQPKNSNNTDDLSPISNIHKQPDSLSNSKIVGTVQAPRTSLQNEIPVTSNSQNPIQSPRTSIKISKLQKHKQLLKLINRSVNECKYCHFPLNDLRKVIHEGVYAKYESATQRTYNTNIINDIIFNANTHVVSIFKDYLIYDDLTEFMKRFYTQKEASERSHKLCTFYDKYSKVFPNYISLEEKKYMFKNIERKQKMIDEKHNALQKAADKNTEDNDAKIFNTKFVENISINKSRATIRQPANMNLDELVDNFIACDTMDGGINITNCENIEASFVENKKPIKQKEVPIMPLIQPFGTPVKKPQVYKFDTKRNILSKAESARKKSEEAANVLAATKKINKQNICPLSDKLLGVINEGSILGSETSRKQNYQNPFAPYGVTPSAAQNPLAKFKIRKPDPQFKKQQILVPSIRHNSSSSRQHKSGELSKNDSQKSLRRDPLSININLNLILPKDKSQNDGTQSVTAAGMYRFKSLERVRIENNNRKVLFAGMATPKPIQAERHSRGHYGSVIKTRHGISRQSDMQSPTYNLQRVYSNPSLYIKPSPISRHTNQRIDSTRKIELVKLDPYKNIRELSSPLSKRVSVHTKSKSTIPYNSNASNNSNSGLNSLSGRYATMQQISEIQHNTSKEKDRKNFIVRQGITKIFNGTQRKVARNNVVGIASFNNTVKKGNLGKKPNINV